MPAPGRSLLPRKLIVGESIVSVSGFSFILVQNRWSYLLPVVPLGQGGMFWGILRLSKGCFFSCAIAGACEPNWAIATAARAVEAVTSLKNALRVLSLLLM